jgi:hypothetical protein
MCKDIRLPHRGSSPLKVELLSFCRSIRWHSFTGITRNRQMKIYTYAICVKTFACPTVAHLHSKWNYTGQNFLLPTFISQKFENGVRIYDQLILISFEVYTGELSRRKNVIIQPWPLLLRDTLSNFDIFSGFISCKLSIRMFYRVSWV